MGKKKKKKADEKQEASAPKKQTKKEDKPKKEKTVSQIKAEKLYGLGLHESYATTSGHNVTRVPGGFIYLTRNSMASEAETVFVPFNEEFKP